MKIKYELISKHRSALMGAAMLAVLLFHAFDIDLGSDTLNLLRNYLFIGVDMFIFLSGVGISMSLSKREVEYLDYMKRRASRILPEYYIVVIPWTIFYVFAHGGAWSSLIWNTTLLAYWVKPAGAFNWYVTGIMLLYAIAPFWNKVITKKYRELYTLGAVVFTLLCTLLLMRDGFWYYLDIIYRVPIFLVGMLVGKYIFEGKALGIGGIVGTVISLIAGLLLFLGAVRGVGLIMPCFAFILLVFPILFALAALFEYLPFGLLEKCLNPLGECSLEIYLLNASIFIETELLRRLIDFGPTNRLYYLVIFAVNIALGIGFAKLMKLVRTRLAKRGAA